MINVMLIVIFLEKAFSFIIWLVKLITWNEGNAEYIDSGFKNPNSKEQNLFQTSLFFWGVFFCLFK